MDSKEYMAMSNQGASGSGSPAFGEFSAMPPPAYPGSAAPDDDDGDDDDEDLAHDADDDGVDVLPTAPPMESMDKVMGYQDIGFDASLHPPPSYAECMGERPVRVSADSIPRVTEDEAREALLGYVSEECCYGTGAARNLVFQELKHIDAFHYTLETFTEARHTAWWFVPFTGQYIDGPENGPAPAPWDMPVVFPELFVDLVQPFEVPHTASVKPCHNCCATGKVTCTKCRGKGRVRCSHCNGRGYKYVRRNKKRVKRNCSWCTGGKRRCSKCGGSGHITCPACNGMCRLKCYIQLTVTWTNHVTHHVIERTELPDDLIKTVTGHVAFEEQQPRVWPISHFPDAEVNQASADLLGKHAQDYRTERIHMQRHKVQVVPETQAMYRWKGENSDYFVYGLERKVYAPNYPQQCCWGCNIL